MKVFKFNETNLSYFIGKIKETIHEEVRRMEEERTESFVCECFIFTDEDGNNGIKPVYQTKLAACADIALPKQIVIPAQSTVKIDLLIGFNIPDHAKIVMYPRSSLLVKKSLIQPVSIIDADYSGQHVHVPLYNPTGIDIILERGERVAQIECVPRHNVIDWARKDEERTGGFGSTGE